MRLIVLFCAHEISDKMKCTKQPKPIFFEGNSSKAGFRKYFGEAEVQTDPIFIRQRQAKIGVTDGT